MANSSAERLFLFTNQRKRLRADFGIQCRWLHRYDHKISLRNSPADELRGNPFKIDNYNSTIPIRRSNGRNNLGSPDVSLQPHTIRCTVCRPA